MPNQDQTGPNRQRTGTGKRQAECWGFKPPAAGQDTSLFGALRRQFRNGQQEQGRGRRNGRGKGAGFRGGCRR